MPLSVLRRLVWREFHDQTRSHWFLGLTAIATLLAPIVISAGVRDYSTRQLQFDLLVGQRLAAGNLHHGLLTGRQLEPALRMVRPSAPAMVLVRGFSAVIPRFWDFAPDGLHPASGDDTARTPQSGVSLDLEFVIRIVLGLLAVSMAAGSIAADREIGTLDVLLSQPVSAAGLVVTKLLGGVAAMVLALVLVMTTSTSALGFFGPDLWTGDFKWTLIGVGISSALYLAVLYALGFALGTVARSLSAANVLALSTWVILVLASTPGFDFLARVLAPVPAHEVIATQRQTTFDGWLDQTQMELGTWYLEAVGSNWQHAPVSPANHDEIAKRWAARVVLVRRDLGNIDDELGVPSSRQRAIWNKLSWWTPGSLFFDATSRIAGVGLPMAESWDTFARDTQQGLEQALFDQPAFLTIAVPMNPGRGLFQIDLRPPPTAKSLAPSIPTELPIRRRIADAAGPCIKLVGYFAALVGLIFFVFPGRRR
jgi:ABC-type transport system involved in multi-copper enzyme maturation permease subunit